jgi:hypothetical protein
MKKYDHDFLHFNLSESGYTDFILLTKPGNV